jgi:hypothetical protein
MAATLTAPALDLDAAGLLLVREVEDYLRQVTPAPALGTGLDLARLLAKAPPPRPYGSVVTPWWAGWPEPPAPSLLDRLRHRRPVADVSPAEHLQLVARYITAHGWTQGALWTQTGAVCVLGAQLRVLAAGYGTADTIRRARQRLGNELGYLGQPMPVDTFNDLPSTSWHDVHRLLERAATR